jgi:hypothetical protein
MVNTCPEPVEGVNTKFGGLIMATEAQNLPFSSLPCLYFLLSAIVALHLSRVLYKFTPFYAKQTQFPKNQNEIKLLFNKDL